MEKLIFIVSIFFLSIEAYSQEAKDDIYFPEEGSRENDYIKNRVNSVVLLEKGNALYNSEAFDEAVKVFEEILRHDPYHVMAYFGRANSREHLGDTDGALADYRIVHHLDPEMSEAFFNCAILEFNSGDFQAAVPLFEKLLLMPEGATQAIYFKGVQYSPNAQPVLSGVSSIGEGKDEIIYHYLGKCYEGLNDYEAAEKNYSKAISTNYSPAIYLDRGIMRHKFDRMRDAIADFQQTLALDPQNSLALYWLSIVSEESGDDSLSIATLDKVINGENVFPEAYIHRGVLKYKLGKYKEAIRDFDSAIALSPEIAEAFINRGLAKSKIMDYRSAIKDFNRALTLDRLNVQAYQSRGNAYFKIENYAAAVRDYSFSIKLDQQNPNLYYNRALALNNLSENKNASEVCEDLHKAITLGMETATKALKDLCH